MSDSNEYGYVVATLGFAAAVNLWMAISVGRARKKIGLNYPKMFATGDSPDEVKFNCTQRAHQNHVEQAPLAMICIAALGAQKPVTAAALGMVYTIGRIIYFKGYSSGNADKRGPGAIISFLALAGAVGTSMVTGLLSSGLF
ncbi:hypothetical protein BSKO_03533 [Bryopsis sp. KO-2023]|nr:hypothetical protein BSKO_03533 [Bryopsis sp. KO-2023]